MLAVKYVQQFRTGRIFQHLRNDQNNKDAKPLAMTLPLILKKFRLECRKHRLFRRLARQYHLAPTGIRGRSSGIQTNEADTNWIRSCIHTFLALFFRPDQPFRKLFSCNVQISRNALNRPKQPTAPLSSSTRKAAPLKAMPTTSKSAEHASATSPCIQIPADAATPAPICGRYGAKIGSAPDNRFRPREITNSRCPKWTLRSISGCCVRSASASKIRTAVSCAAAGRL